MDFKRLQNYVFFGVLIGISAVFFWMVRPYFYPVFWAAIIAAMFQPLYRRVLKLLRGRTGLAAGLTEIIIALLFVLPLSGIVLLIIQQAVSLYGSVDQDVVIKTITDYINELRQWPIIRRVIELIDLNDVTSRLSSVGSTISKWLYQFITNSGQQTAQWLIQLFIMLYTLFYFLKDGEKFLKQLMHLVPLGDDYEVMLYERFISTTRATLKGTMLIGIIQGAIGGLALAIAGVPASIFWAMIMAVFSIIPGISATVVMVPAIIIMLLLGNYWQAIVIIIGLVAASLVDNLLRGPLVGKDAQMHPLLIFFATIGGIVAFGISGIIIGPIITAFFLSIWGIYEQKYHKDLQRVG